MYDKNYFNSATLKDVKAFDSYVSFLTTLGINLRDKKILDIGCATGEFISRICSDNVCFGVDISAYAVEHCQAAFPAIRDNFFCLDLNTEIIKDREFDIITLFDVLEHLTNFTKLADLIRESLRPGGILLITTPNANSVTRFLSVKNFTGEIDNTHKTLFTPYTLDFFLRRLGLKKVALFTPYVFHFKMDFLSKNILLGGQIVAIYEKNAC